MSKTSPYPIKESVFYSVYIVEAGLYNQLVETLDHVKLKGETLISVTSSGAWYTIVAAKP